MMLFSFCCNGEHRDLHRVDRLHRQMFIRDRDAFNDRVFRNSLRPPAVPGIGRTEKYGCRLFDPSVRLVADSRDN